MNASKKWIVGIPEPQLAPFDIEQAAFPEADFRLLGDWRTSSPQDLDPWRRAHALLVWHQIVDPPLAAILENCRIVVRYGVGYDRVDVGALVEKGIAFSNNPDYGTEEVADTACAMILAIQRKIVAHDRLARGYRNGWQTHVLSPLRRTSHETLGIIGVGRIGTAVCLRMKAFGYRVVGYDPYQVPGHEKAVGYVRAHSLDALRSQADIITLHCPLTPETRGMVDGAFLSAMRPGASLVNTARGEILDGLDGLADALKSGHLAAAALDVLPAEPPGDHPLIRDWRNDAAWLRGRLIVNPHNAFYSEQAIYDCRFKAAETARLLLAEGRRRNLIEAD